VATKINSPIVDYEVIKPAEAAQPTTPGNDEPTQLEALPVNVVHMHEKVERPESLLGSTYKIKTPLSEHALYVTINDIILNPGTPYEKRRPFEIFINSKNMDHFQWIVALTRIVSAVFRKGGDVTFLVEELRSVFDPRGGYFKRGGKYMPSLVAEIGDAIEVHMKSIGMIAPDVLEDHQQQLIDEKRREFEGRKESSAQTSTGLSESASTEDAGGGGVNAAVGQNDSGFPAGAKLCAKCLTNASVLMDGCMTCLNCGDSKCG